MEKDKEKIRELVRKLYGEIQDEEEVGGSLCTAQYQNPEELQFFTEEDSARVVEVLNRLAADSKRHIDIVRQIIHSLEGRFKNAG